MHTRQELDDLLRRVPDGDIVSLLERAGAQVWKETPREIWLTTICHGGDSHKLCYFRDDKTFHCYTNCGHMDLFDLVGRVFQCPFPVAVDKVAALATGIGGAPPRAREMVDTLREIAERRGRASPPPIVCAEIPPWPLECYESGVYYSGWRDEGISAGAMAAFGIMWDEVLKEIIIPHRDAKGRLIGIRRRATNPDDPDKYRPVMLGGRMYNHPVGANLYGAWEHGDAIRRKGTAVLFEGEKSVLKHHTMYGEDSTALAVCGFNITEAQKRLLLELGVRDATIAFDKECEMSGAGATRTPEYARYCERVNSLGRRLAPWCRVYGIEDTPGLLGLKDSPVDRGKGVFERLMRARKAITIPGQAQGSFNPGRF